MTNLFARLNSRRTQRLAAAAVEQVPAEIDKPKETKGLFGKLLEKTGEWVKPLSRARVNAADLQGKPEWEEAKNLDLSNQAKLPANFTAPAELEKIRFNYDADQANGIARDKALLSTIPADKKVEAEFVISTKEIFTLLQDSPEKLCPEMAHVLTGSREGIKGLSDEALFKSLYRLERKFDATKLNDIDPEVKNILLAKLKESDNPKIWKQTSKLENILKSSKYESETTQNQITIANKASTQEAKKVELDEIEATLKRVQTNDLDEAEVKAHAKKILEHNLGLIKQRLNLGHSGRREMQARETIKKQIEENLFTNITNEELKHSLINITYKSLQRLENQFENGATKAAKRYTRLTDLNIGSKEKLLYATALMERNSGILPGSKNYGIKALAS